MSHVLLITPAGSYRVGDYLTAAWALCCDVTVVTDAAVAIAGSAIVTRFDDPARAAAAALARLDRPVDAVVGTEGAAVAVAGEIARRRGLPCNPRQALAAAVDKLAQRHLLGARGRATARLRHRRIQRPNRCRATAAAVVKPVDRTASQGVLRADTHDRTDRGSGARRVQGRRRTSLVPRVVAAKDRWAVQPIAPRGRHVRRSPRVASRARASPGDGDTAGAPARRHRCPDAARGRRRAAGRGPRNRPRACCHRRHHLHRARGDRGAAAPTATGIWGSCSPTPRPPTRARMRCAARGQRSMSRSAPAADHRFVGG